MNQGRTGPLEKFDRQLLSSQTLEPCHTLGMLRQGLPLKKPSFKSVLWLWLLA